MNPSSIIARQSALFDEPTYDGPRRYLPRLTAIENQKGVLDVDTVKGCTIGMRVYSDGGCYGECYAQKTADRYGIDFATSVSRKLHSYARIPLFMAVKNHPASWYRIGTAGDPCHDWENTLSVCEALKGTGKVPVIITKHWMTLSHGDLVRLRNVNGMINTSTSGLDSDAETKHRVRQIYRIREFGVKSINRVVTCAYGDTDYAKQCAARQQYLLTIGPVIDNPLRASKTSRLVVDGHITLTRSDDALGGGKMVSLHNQSVYLGHCSGCPDQCGVTL